MGNEQQIQESESADPNAQEPEGPGDPAGSEGELRLRVRKLELPVRPRGVLAE